MLTLMDSAAWPKVIKMMVREKRSTEISQTVREARHVNSRGPNTHVWRYKVKSDEPPPLPSELRTEYLPPQALIDDELQQKVKVTCGSTIIDFRKLIT